MQHPETQRRAGRRRAGQGRARQGALRPHTTHSQSDDDDDAPADDIVMGQSRLFKDSIKITHSQNNEIINIHFFAVLP